MRIKHKWLFKFFCWSNRFSVEYDTMTTLFGSDRELIILHRRRSRRNGGAH